MLAALALFVSLTFVILPSPSTTPLSTARAARPQPLLAGTPGPLLVPPILSSPVPYLPPSTATTVTDLSLPAPLDRPEPPPLPPTTLLAAAPTTRPGIVLPLQLSPGPPPAATPAPPDCREQARTEGGDEHARLARMTWSMFHCVLTGGGLAGQPPTAHRGWDGGQRWGFRNLAEQVAAEAVVVAYCESDSFSSRAIASDNPWGYGGLFQMGDTEMRLFGAQGASKFDPIDNAHAAATYFLYAYRKGEGWGGWAPWAVVNTNFADEVNDQVKVPVLPRFVSTDPDWKGRRGPELPEWAVDPWGWHVPVEAGCPFAGQRWAPSVPIQQAPAFSSQVGG